jgi:hypothetical protein
VTDTAGGPEDTAPDLHADEPRRGSAPAGAELPGSGDTAQATSEELAAGADPHVPEIDETGDIAPGRYRTEGAPGARDATS